MRYPAIDGEDEEKKKKKDKSKRRGWKEEPNHSGIRSSARVGSAGCTMGRAWVGSEEDQREPTTTPLHHFMKEQVVKLHAFLSHNSRFRGVGADNGLGPRDHPRSHPKWSRKMFLSKVHYMSMVRVFDASKPSWQNVLAIEMKPAPLRLHGSGQQHCLCHVVRITPST